MPLSRSSLRFNLIPFFGTPPLKVPPFPPVSSILRELSVSVSVPFSFLGIFTLPKSFTAGTRKSSGRLFDIDDEEEAIFARLFCLSRTYALCCAIHRLCVPLRSGFRRPDCFRCCFCLGRLSTGCQLSHV